MKDQKKVYGSPLDSLFAETKKEYAGDKIFEEDEQVNLKHNAALETSGFWSATTSRLRART